MVIDADAGAVVQGEFFGKILGFDADVCAGPISGEVGRLGFHDDQIVHECRGEEVHFNAVATWVHGGHLCAVKCGLDVPVAQSTHKHEVANRADTGHTLDRSCGVTVASLLDLLTGNEVHA